LQKLDHDYSAVSVDANLFLL